VCTRKTEAGRSEVLGWPGLSCRTNLKQTPPPKKKSERKKIIFTAILEGSYYHPCLGDKDMEAQRGQDTCLSSPAFKGQHKDSSTEHTTTEALPEGRTSSQGHGQRRRMYLWSSCRGGGRPPRQHAKVWSPHTWAQWPQSSQTGAPLASLCTVWGKPGPTALWDGGDRCSLTLNLED
jgi:hypothetical protein